MATRNIQDISSDVKKLQELMSILAFIGNGYTLKQRIEHHETVAGLLKELLMAYETDVGEV